MAIVQPGLTNGGFTTPPAVPPRTVYRAPVTPRVPNGGFNTTTTPPVTPPVTPPANAGGQVGPPSSQIPAWAAQGNNPYNIPALQTFYNVYKQNPAFAMSMLQKLPGMNNLVLSAVNGGALGRNEFTNPAVNDFKNLQGYYEGGNGGSIRQGIIPGLGANPMNPNASIAGGWSVAPGGMANLGNIRQWAGQLQAAANSNNASAYNGLMANLPQGIQMINFNTQGLQGGMTGAGPDPYAATTGTAQPQSAIQNPQTTPGQVAPNTPTPNLTQTPNQYGAGYTGYGNTHISSGTTPGTTGTGVGANTTTNPPSGINNPGIPNGGFVPPAPAAPTSAVPRARVANPGLTNGGFTNPGITQPSIPNGGFGPTNRTTMPVPSAPVGGGGNYNYTNQTHYRARL